MKSINSISGGKTSAYIAMHYPADYNIFSVVCTDDEDSRIKDVQMNNYINDKLSNYTSEYGQFIATAEDDKTLYAMRDLEQLMGSELIWVRGASFDDVIDSKNKSGSDSYSRLPSKLFRYCTTEMKMLPIFKWWLSNIGEKVKMRIGFRSDEYMRMERFMNKNPNHFKFADYCKNYGNKNHHFKNYDWRYCSFDLIKDSIDKQIVDDYWKYNGFIGSNDLFDKKRQIVYPVISNCVGCFWKKESTLAVMSEVNNSKMEWFAGKELIGKGTWKQGGNDYRNIIDNRVEIAKEEMFEVITLGESCDTGGCHG